MKYEQLPLYGGEEDFRETVKLLQGYKEVYEAINTFYTLNGKWNPRQIYTILDVVANDIQLDTLYDCECFAKSFIKDTGETR